VKPEPQKFLDKARSDLADAKKIAAIELANIAARAAYYAAFHANHRSTGVLSTILVGRPADVIRFGSGPRSAHHFRRDFLHAARAVTFMPRALSTLKKVESFGSPSGVSAL
jgi:hypothetical protein